MKTARLGRRAFSVGRGVRHRLHGAADHIPGPTHMDIAISAMLSKAKYMVGLLVQVVDLISVERLATFEGFTDTRERAIALHHQTLQLGASLMSLIALLELALRNSTDQHLIEKFSDRQWLLPGRAAVPLKPRETEAAAKAYDHARRAAQSKIIQQIKLSGQSVPKLLPNPLVTHGQVLSQTTFSFWRHLYSDEYEATLWKPALKRVFPNKSLRRSELSKALAAVHEARNRAAHHEPIYGTKLDEAIQALDFVRDNLGARTEGEDTSFRHFSRIQHLRVKMDLESYREAWATLALPKP